MRLNDDTPDALALAAAAAEPSPIEAGDKDVGSKTAIVAVTLAGIGAFLNLYATQPILPLLAQLFHAGKSAVGMTVSGSTLGVALAAPIVGVLAERVGRRRVIIASTFVLAVPTLLAATSVTLPALIWWRFLQGVVMPGIFGVTIAYITEEWSASAVAKVMSLYVSGTVLGGFLGRVFTGFAATHSLIPNVRPSWHIGFIAIGLCDLVFGVLIWRWLPADRPGHASARRFNPIRHLRNKQLLATYAVGFSVLFSLVAVFTYITFHLAAPPFLLTPAQLSWLFVVYLVGLFVTPVAGVWTGRVGSRISLIVAVIAAMIGVSLTLVHSIPVILVGLVLCSSGVFVCQSASTSYIQRAAPEGGRASAAGQYVSFYYIGGSLAGVLPAYVWNHGEWTACVVLVLIVQAITIAIAASVWEN